MKSELEKSRILANENVSRGVIVALRGLGYDVLSAKESMRGMSDQAVLERARLDGRLLVTHDKDFGELAFRSRLTGRCGILLFRFPSTDPQALERKVLALIDSRLDWAGYFTVVSDKRIRRRPLPEPPYSS